MNNASSTTLKSTKTVRALLLSLCVIFSLSILSACGLQTAAVKKDEGNRKVVTADISIEYFENKDNSDHTDVFITDSSSARDGSALIYKWVIDNNSVDLNDSKLKNEYYHKLETGGTHTIKLTVISKSTKLSGEDTVAYDIDVDRKAKPTAAFSVKWSGKKVTLTNNSTCEGNGSITTNKWYVDNSSIGTDINVTHTFTDNATHSVKLVVVAYSGDNSTENKLLDAKAGILLTPVPLADFTYVVDGRKVTLTNKTTIADGSLMNYQWEIDDAVATLDNNSYTFASDGEKAIRLTAVRNDNKSVSNYVIKHVTVATTAPAKDIPEADFVFEVKGLRVDFTDASTVKDNAELSYKWLIDSETIPVPNPTYPFKSDGDKEVKLTVSRVDNPSISNSITRVVTLKAPDKSPKPSFTYQFSQSSTAAAWIVTFKNETTVEDSSALMYEWEVDKQISTADNPTFTFATTGSREVTLTATRKDDGSSVTIKQSINIALNAQ